MILGIQESYGGCYGKGALEICTDALAPIACLPGGSGVGYSVQSVSSSLLLTVQILVGNILAWFYVEDHTQHRKEVVEVLLWYKGVMMISVHAQL